MYSQHKKIQTQIHWLPQYEPSIFLLPMNNNMSVQVTTDTTHINLMWFSLILVLIVIVIVVMLLVASIYPLVCKIGMHL